MKRPVTASLHPGATERMNGVPVAHHRVSWVSIPVPPYATSKKRRNYSLPPRGIDVDSSGVPLLVVAREVARCSPPPGFTTLGGPFAQCTGLCTICPPCGRHNVLSQFGAPT